MQKYQRLWRSVVAVMMVIVGLRGAAMIPVAQADSRNPNSQVLPFDSSPYGNTYGLAFDEGEYQDSDNDGVKDRPMPIHSLTTYDLTTRWQANDQLTFSAGGRNIFNAKPPFALIDRRPFDASRYDLRGRVLYAEARVTF